MLKQIDIAKHYVFQKEKPGNDFDIDTPLGKILKEAGHKDGEAWCAYFMEGVFVETLRALFSASTVQTFHNFKNAGYEISRTPKIGSLVVWQNYKDGKPLWSGHAGVVTGVQSDGTFFTIEGNTNSSGSREGTSVQEKMRRNENTDNGLNILGFVEVV